MFNKNIEALSKVNKILANKLLSIDIKDASKHISATKNEQGEYLLTCNNQFIDDTPSPLDSAKKIYAENIKSATTRHDFIIIFGLGLGNLLDYTHNKSMCDLILYEPDINILRFTFEYVDLTKYFADGRLYISNNIIDCAKFIENNFLIDDKIEFVYLKNYVLLHPSEFNVLTEKVFEVCQDKIISMNTTKTLSKAWTTNIFRNSLCKTISSYPIDILENQFEGKTALILGAGPSLKHNIEKIKENRDKFIIFTIHRALKTLKEYDIIPDFCIVVDAKYVNYSIEKDKDYLAKINLIKDIKADKGLDNSLFKTCFIYYSQNNYFSKKLSENYLFNIKPFETGGTSTISAYRCAKFLGCKNIAFAGVDLAFDNDTVYCDGEIATMKESNSVIIQNAQQNITTVKSVTGKYISTRVDYANFVKQFELIFAKDKTSNLYNLTSFGAFISGMKYVSFEESLENIDFEPTDTQSIVLNKIEENNELSSRIYDASLEILKEEYSKIQPIADLAREWFEMYAEHPNYFEYGTKIITKIISTMILQEFVQIEIIKFSKVIYSKDDEQKKELLTKIMNYIISYDEYLYNLIKP